MCKKCPLPVLFEDYPTQQRAMAYADTIHEFYSRLGIGGERDVDRTQLLMTRWNHTYIVGRALAASGLIAPDVPASGEGEFYDCEALLATLLRELEQAPLER